MKKLILLCLAFLFFSCSGEVSGLISVKGNVPNTYVSLTTDDGKTFALSGDLAGELGEKYQNRRVTIKGHKSEKKNTTSLFPEIVVDKFTLQDK